MDTPRAASSFRVVPSATLPPLTPPKVSLGTARRWTRDPELGGKPLDARWAQSLRVSYDRGMLVADHYPPDAEPAVNLEAIEDDDGVHGTYWIGDRGGCSEPNVGRDRQCTELRVRFGALAGNGDFSGWTEWTAVAVPGATLCSVGTSKMVDAEARRSVGVGARQPGPRNPSEAAAAVSAWVRRSS